MREWLVHQADALITAAIVLLVAAGAEAARIPEVLGLISAATLFSALGVGAKRLSKKSDFRILKRERLALSDEEIFKAPHHGAREQTAFG
jgi:hypothetical protein